MSYVSASFLVIPDSYLSSFFYYAVVNIHCFLVLLIDPVGLCGSPRITDVGGVPYLVPLVQKDKVLHCKIVMPCINIL